MITQQPQQAIFSLLIQDSRRVFEVIIDRYNLYHRLTKTSTALDFTEGLSKHQEINLRENKMVQPYKGKVIINMSRLKSFLVRFHCRLEEMLIKIGGDPQFIKTAALEYFGLLRKGEVGGETVMRSLSLRPKIETEKILHKTTRNKSLVEIRDVRKSFGSRNNSVYPVLPENKGLLSEWSKSSRRQYGTLDIDIKQMYCFSRSKGVNQQRLLEQIIQRNKSAQHTIQSYKTSYKQQRRRTKVRKVDNSKEVVYPATFKVQLSSYPKKVNLIRKRTPKPLHQLMNRTTLVF